MKILPVEPDHAQDDDDFCRRWPPNQYPGLHLSAAQLLAHRERQQRRQEALDLIVEDMADIALAVFTEAQNGRG